jgi:hypothetical protein
VVQVVLAVVVLVDHLLVQQMAQLVLQEPVVAVVVLVLTALPLQVQVVLA